jgi:2-polyprenyl-3-methyl-5-hydroxy-6-metoxy-1,4-benzoquinol methylase
MQLQEHIAILDETCGGGELREVLPLNGKSSQAIDLVYYNDIFLVL